MDRDVQTRKYNSELRAEQQDQTRLRILEAAAELMGDPTQPELTFAAIGKQARISDRTVYRHFPTKEDLLEAFWSYVNAQLGMAEYPESAEQLLKVMPSVYEGFDAQAGLIRAHLASPAGREMRQRIAPVRRELFQRMLESYTAGLPAKSRRRVYAIVQLLFSPRAWDSLVENWDMDGSEAAEACSWAIRTLLTALEGESPRSSKSMSKPGGSRRTKS
jgi:AcrR family transcriptional regulator